MTLRIATRDGVRLFVPAAELRELLDLDTETYSKAVELLVASGYITRHRRDRAPVRGFTLPASWDSTIFMPHLKRIARELLADAGVEVGAARDGLGKLGRIVIG